MTPGNGHSDGSSRLDRIEAALEMMIRDHEEFREKHRKLLTAQVLMQDEMQRGFKKFRQKMDEVTDNLNGLIGAVDQMRANFDARLRRLEGDA
jgi:hypothetical protein